MPSRQGKPNRNKVFLLNRLQDMYGEDFHPIMKMAENAVLLQAEAENSMDVNTLKTAVDAWDKVAQYTEPKLKAIEGTLSVDAEVMMKDLKGVPR
jgi:hypothetical protein